MSGRASTKSDRIFVNKLMHDNIRCVVLFFVFLLSYKILKNVYMCKIYRACFVLNYVYSSE